jgi:F-type H+-transporting ATPase subunit gamma
MHELGKEAVAIGRTLASFSSGCPDGMGRSSRPALVVFSAEQGFAGAFSERVLDAIGADLSASNLFLIGTEGGAVAVERGLVAHWKSAMPSHSAGVPKLADRVAEALYFRIATGEIDRLDAIFSGWRPGHGIHVNRRRLFPFDVAQFPHPQDAKPPFVNLPPQALLNELTADYLHAQLCDAALHAFAAENEARMEAMAAAHNQIERQLSTLRTRQQQVRQEEITAEIIELAAGEKASRLTSAVDH